jgi:hypothetical protein
MRDFPARTKDAGYGTHHPSRRTKPGPSVQNQVFRDKPDLLQGILVTGHMCMFDWSRIDHRRDNIFARLPEPPVVLPIA